MEHHIEIKKEEKKMGVVVLTALITGNMIGSAIFLLPSTLARFGSISILSWIITTIGSLALAFMFSRMSILIPKQGGPYAYVRAGLGNPLGFQTSLTYWLFAWTGNVAIVIAGVGYLSAVFPIFAEPLIALVTSIGFIWIFTYINLIGTREASIVSLVATIFKLIPILLVVIFGWFYFHPEYITQAINVTSPRISNFSAIGQGVLLTLWGLVGIESGTVPANAVKNPQKTIPIATIAGVLIGGAAYILSSLVIMGMIPNDILQHSVSPFADAAQMIFGNYGKWIIAIGAVISCLGCLNGWILLQGQIPMAAAEDHLFLKIFARKNKKGVPAQGVIISSILITLVLIMTASPDLVNQYKVIISIATLAALVVYVYTPVSELIMHKKRVFKLSKKSIACAIAALAYSLIAIIGADQESLAMFAILLIISIPLYYFAEKKTQTIN